MLHSTDRAGRKAERAQIRAGLLARAERDAARIGLSLRCRGWGAETPPAHAGGEDGCTNDGSSCLCVCHDPEDGDTDG